MAVEQEVMEFRADTRKGTIELVSGRAFVGGIYNVNLLVDDEPGETHGLVFYATQGLPKPVCVASYNCFVDPVTNTLQDPELKFDSVVIRDLFKSTSGADLQSIKLTAYLCRGQVELAEDSSDATEGETEEGAEEGETEEPPAYENLPSDVEYSHDISAKGEIKLWWTPVLSIIDGTPIDTKGEKGDTGEAGNTYVPELIEEEGKAILKWTVAQLPLEEVITSAINLKGPQGETGPQGIRGVQGPAGETYVPEVVEDEEGAYLIFHHSGGTLGSDVNLKGPKGDPGPQGETGPKGDKGVYYIPGMYESGDAVYVRWVTSDGDVVNGAFNIKGPQGPEGKSAYEVAVENGYTGTEAEYTEMVTSVPENAQRAEDAAADAVKAQEVVEGIKTELQSSVDDIALAMRRSVFDATAVSAETIILNPNVGYYYKSLDEDAYTFVLDTTSFEVEEGEIAKINLLLEIGDVTPTVAFPANVYFSNNAPVFRPETKMLIELASTNQGATWIGRMAWTTSNYAYEVAYLTQSGTQYIDLGIEPDNDFVVRFKSQITTTAQGRRGVFGRYIASNSRQCLFGYERYSTPRFAMGWNGHDNTLVVDEAVYADVSKVVLDKTGLTVNGTRLWEISATSINQDDLTLFFGSVSGSWQTTGFVGNLYYLTIEKNGEKVMDLIPVVDWDGVACWHDKVSGNNYYNNGTGKFEVGPRV